MAELKKGDIRFTVMWTGTRIEFWEWHLRTIQNRKDFYGRTTFYYWWPKLQGITWGKLSKKHFDYGWLPKASGFWRRKCLKDDPPGRRNKLGALAEEIADLRRSLKDWGDDPDPDDGVRPSEQLAVALRAQKRMRAKVVRETKVERPHAGLMVIDDPLS